MSDEQWVLVFVDGHEEKVWAAVHVRDGSILEVVEHYGVTFGEKSRRMIPLAQLREWRRTS